MGKSIVESVLDKSYPRNLYIEDLTLNKYDNISVIEFESVQTFFKFVQLYPILNKKTYKIKIDTQESVDNLLQFIMGTTVFNINKENRGNRIELIMSSQLFLNNISSNLNKLLDYDIIVFLTDDNINMFDILKKESESIYIKSKPVYSIIQINYMNYIEQINLIVHNYMVKGLRFVKILFDYASFNNMTLGELSSLEFWLHHLNCWRIADKTIKNRLVIYNRNDFNLSVYINSELKIYYSEWYAQQLSEDYIDDLIQSDDDYKTISKFLKYACLKKEVLYFMIVPKHINWDLIDYGYNYNILGEVNEIPTITLLINNWLVI